MVITYSNGGLLFSTSPNGGTALIKPQATGTVLTSNGPTNPPSFQAAGASIPTEIVNDGGSVVVNSDGSVTATLPSGKTFFITGSTASSALELITNGSAESLSIFDFGANGANIGLHGSGSTTPNKYIRAQSGSLQVINDAYSSAIIVIKDDGSLGIGGTPGVDLDVNRTSANAIIRAQTTTSGNAELSLLTNGNAEYTFIANRSTNTLTISGSGVLTLQIGNATGGVQVGSPTGGDKGSGTLNTAGNMYVNNNIVANAGQYGINSSGAVSLSFLSNFPGSYTLTGTNRFEQVAAVTLPSAGVWWFYGQVTFQTPGTGEAIYCALGKNSTGSTAQGSQTIGSRIAGNQTNLTPNSTVVNRSCSGPYTGSAGDVVGLFMFDNVTLVTAIQTDGVGDPGSFMYGFRMQ